MLEPQSFIRQGEAVAKALGRRGLPAEWIAETAALVAGRREAQHTKEAAQQALNAATQDIQARVRAGDQAAVAQARQALKALKLAAQDKEQTFAQAEAACHERLLQVPNPPSPKVPDGKGEGDNVEVSRSGTPRASEGARSHWDLGEALGLLDFGRASQVSGPRFAYLFGPLAKLERALGQLMLDMAGKHGYREVAPPLLVRPQAMEYSGQYPKFLGESFETQEREQVLIPTSEVPLLSLHAGEIVPEEALPLRYAALTPCFRREAGAAGRDTRGYVRQHQFYKVELVALTTPEQSEAEHERMTANAAAVLQVLELPYRLVHLCAGDMGFAAQSTYDLEVWLPGQDAYREISSCSNCGDFQARRAQIRSRRGGAGGDSKNKPRLVHTLNGSGLAVGRTLVAVLENYQQPDGSIAVPMALRPYLGGLERLAAEPMFAPGAL